MLFSSTSTTSTRAAHHILIFCAALFLSTRSVSSTNVFLHDEGLAPPNAQEDDNHNEKDLPNVLIIMTDEHNLRTLGCYRDLMVQSEAEVWGEGIKVETPHLDSIAKNGALFSNFMTVSPVCTPSRASFLTGTYASTHGAVANAVPMNKDAVTFAEILKSKLGYSTSYMGKWHLNGELKEVQEFGAPKGRSFGFQDTRYQWNRGHWKFIRERTDGSIQGFTYAEGKANFESSKRQRQAYSTDFLTSQAIEYINNQASRSRTTPFTLMVSFPDPHGPQDVRYPYNSMFDHFNFEIPKSAVASLNKQPGPPKWAWAPDPIVDGKDIPLDKMKKAIQLHEKSQEYQTLQRETFGMVKLIDDSIGKILQALENNDIKTNTIVIFTSDHGGLMGEHNSAGKGVPYKTSVGVPFLIQWPGKIPSGKLIKTAYSSIDFVPSLLNLLGLDPSQFGLGGLDFSHDVMNEEMIVSDENQVRFLDMVRGDWAAAVSQRYKLVLSTSRVAPWLLDAVADPNEGKNYFNENENQYQKISRKMKKALANAMEENEFSLWNQDEPVYLSNPACRETRDQLDGDEIFTVCADYKKDRPLQDKCQTPALQTKCPVTCNSCFKDTHKWGTIIWKQKYVTCKSAVAVKSSKSKYRRCKIKSIGTFCSETCAEFL